MAESDLLEMIKERLETLLAESLEEFTALTADLSQRSSDQDGETGAEEQRWRWQELIQQIKMIRALHRHTSQLLEDPERPQASDMVDVDGVPVLH